MKLTVIIPTSGRAKKLKTALGSICSNDLQHVSEVLIIENGIKDDSELAVSETVAAFGTQKIQYHYVSVPGLLSGRHMGIERSTGDVLCFLDDDVEISNGYFNNVYRVFTENKLLELATGPCLPTYESAPPDWFTFLWTIIPEGKFCLWFSLLDFGDREIRIDPNFVWGLNFCVRKETAIKYGGFHPDSVPKKLQQYQGDGETALTTKASIKGLKAKYYPGLLLHHHLSKERLSFDYLKERAFYNGVSNSFTRIRSNHLELLKSPSKRNWKDVLLPYYRWIRNFYKQPKTIDAPPEIQDLLNALSKCEEAGYEFHQLHFQNDPRVRDWVLRKDYWDYRLPED